MIIISNVRTINPYAICLIMVSSLFIFRKAVMNAISINREPIIAGITRIIFSNIS